MREGYRLVEVVSEEPTEKIDYFTVQIVDWSINDNDEDLE